MKLKVFLKRHTFKAESRSLVFQVMLLIYRSLFLILIILGALGHLTEALMRANRIQRTMVLVSWPVYPCVPVCV